MSDYSFPLGGTGPGSQPTDEDGAALSFMPMPAEMRTYSMPDVEAVPKNSTRLRNMLHVMQEALDTHPSGAAAKAIELGELSAEERGFIDQLLGEGEVSILIKTPARIHIQESVLAGLWRIQYLDETGALTRDCLEVAEIPAVLREYSFSAESVQKTLEKPPCPPGVNNAVPLLSELNEKIAASDSAREPHVINLTLLPQSDADLAFLEETLGYGTVTVLSRGYGNCRVSSTNTRHVWWVRYFNSQDAVILNTLEVTPVPAVICASPEDIEDSAERLHQIREVYA